MQYTPQPLEAYYEIADKVRSGEYFRESRYMYDVSVHDPMAWRYFYVLITAISTLILLLVVFAANSLYPLKTPIPFIYNPRDIVEDVPNIQSLRAYEGEEPNAAVLRFLISNYVVQREEYDIARIDRNLGSVKSQTAKDAFREYEASLDPRNAESPITLYQRHSKRTISIVSVVGAPDAPGEVVAVYEATVESKKEAKKTRWQANIAFSYSGLELDDKGKPKPISFIVTKYRNKRIQDTR